MEISKTTFLIVSGLVIYIVFNNVLFILQKIIIKRITKYIWVIPGVILGFIISFFLLYLLAEYGRLGCGLHLILLYLGLWLVGFFVPIFMLTKKMFIRRDDKTTSITWWTIMTILIIFLLLTFGALRIANK